MHVSTVSRVLNGDPGLSVRPETIERILSYRARTQGYRPNALARALKQRPDRRGRVRRPAAAQPDLGPAAARRAAAGPRARLRRHDHGGADRGPQAAGRLPVPGRGKPRRRAAAGHLAAAARARMPACTRCRTSTSTGADPIPATTLSWTRQARSGCSLDHVASLGHRSMVVIDGPGDVDTVHRRVNAARRPARPAACRSVRHAPATEEGGWDAMTRLLRRGRDPDGLRRRQHQPAVRRAGRAARRGRVGTRRCVGGELRRGRVPGLPGGPGHQRVHAAGRTRRCRRRRARSPGSRAARRPT